MIKEYIKNHKIITFVGLCKNAGKTTTLCRTINELSDELLAVTSIGRDGESTDLVTGTQKPQIYIKNGTLFATARGMISLCDTSLEVLDVTPYQTPFGKISIFRAVSDGYVQLAGPSIISQLKTVLKTFSEHGAQRILIDGASSRKSLACAGEDSCVVLCVGASMDKSMEKTVLETEHICNLFATPENFDDQLFIDPNEAFILFAKDGKILDLPQDAFDKANFSKFTREPTILWVSGAVTTSFLTSIYKKSLPLTILVPDATHFLCDAHSTKQFLKRGGKFFVKKKLRVAVISANPWSAYGEHYDNDLFLKALKEKISIPIINVKEEQV